MATWAPWAVWATSVVSLVAFLPVHLDIKLTVSVVVGLGLVLLERILMPMRRYYGDSNTQCATMVANYVPSVVAFAAVNAVWSSPDHNLYYIMVCIFLLMLTAFATTRILQWMLFLIFLQGSLIWTGQHLTIVTLYCFLGSLLWLFLLLLLKPRVATKQYITKDFADYMKSESQSLFDGRDASLFPGKYPVLKTHGQMMTINQLVQMPGDMEQYRSRLLPYSYCQLLARRYFGFHCAEEGDMTVRAFAKQMVVNDHRWAFTIVEVQLAFLHDYVFTNCHSMLLRYCPCQLSNERGIRKIFAMIWVARALFGPLATVCWSIILFVVSGSFGVWKIAIHVVATLLFSFLAFFSAKPSIPTEWSTIWTAFQKDCQGGMHELLQWCQRPHWTSSPYWQGKMGQYSLIEDCDSRSLKKAITTWFKERILSEVSHSFVKHYPVENDPISVLDSVKDLVANSLRQVLQNGLPTNGSRSLKENGNWDLLKWTLDEETHTHTILIWHIATWYCDVLGLHDYNTSDGKQVALALSRYCAYLVAFLPDMLPEHVVCTKMVIQEGLQDAKNFLISNMPVEGPFSSQQALPISQEERMPLRQGLLRERRMRLSQLFGKRTRMSVQEKHSKIQGLHQQIMSRPMNNLNTFEKGLKLGKQLETSYGLAQNSSNAAFWNLMADFWVETILYVAPSDNAAVHIEQLARGGEFVTHLWAMLSNAGILKRATMEWSPVASDSQQDPPQPEHDLLQHERVVSHSL